MQKIGAMVRHKTFGKGIIVAEKDGHMTVRFFQTEAEKKFVYPDAFDRFLVFESNELQQEAIAEFLEKERKRQEEKIKSLEEREKKAYEQPIPVQSAKAGKKTRKLPPRKNLAFKLNYCDGGATSDSMGFKAVCSDKTIRYNIEKAKRSWCSFKDCPCRKYYDGLISRGDLDNFRMEGFICYESVALSNWIAHAGTDLKGVNAGKGRRLPNVQLGSLSILTTRYPDTQEQDRVIVGVFIIDASYEGDDTEAGTVSAKSKYKIEIRPDEAQKLKFWNYYRNEGNPDAVRWGTGLYRFIKDKDTVRLLEDIVAIKEGRSDHKLAVDILSYFNQLHES